LQTSILTQKHMDGLRNEIFEKFGDHYKINIEHLEHLHPVDAYLYELFKGFGFTEWNDIKGLLTALSGKEVTSKTHRLIKDRDYLLLTKKADLGERVFHISEKDKQISMPIQLKLEATKTLEIISKNVIFLDKEKLNYPLVLRKWEKGDYFYPFGMKGKKKLSKFFKDEKMDTLSKEKQWLLCSDNSIVWVIGKRLDERFKVGSDTKHILKITFSV
ncbi:MAG: tRNA lysidine(34) synthetase TilS, partial [Flavobacteriaceae bacterium]